MKNKNFAWLFLVLGFLLFFLSIFADKINGEPINLGPAQITLLIFSLFIIALSVGNLFFHLQPIELARRVIRGSLSRTENILGRVQTWCSSWLPQSTSSRIQNIIYITIFVIYSLLFTLGRWNGNTPFVFLRGDASMISGFSAALDHPDLFTRDFFLHPLSNVNWYISIEIPIIRFLGKLLNGYGNAYIFILPVILFLKLFGFYQLGKFLFRRPFLGFLLAAITTPVVYVGVLDYWSLSHDVLPRNLFEIFIPWLILWTIKWNDQPKKWFWFGIIVGGLTYFHSMSALVIFLSVCVALIISSKVNFKSKLGAIFISAIIYAVVLIPFVIGYRPEIPGQQTLSYEAGRDLLLLVNGDYLNPSAITSNLFFKFLRSGLIIPFVIALIIMVTFWKEKRQNNTLLVSGWIIGIIVFTIGLAFIETWIENSLHILPVQFYLIRGIRYLVPLLLVFIFLSFRQLVRMPLKTPYPMIVRSLLSGTFLIIFVYIFTSMIKNNPQDPYLPREINCLRTGRITCQTQEEKDAIDILASTEEHTTVEDVISTLPPFGVTFAQAIRYEILRPLGYNANDAARIRDLSELKKLVDVLQPWRQLEHAPIEEQLNAYLELAPSMGFDWVIIQKADFPAEQIEKLESVYSNDSYMLVRVGD
jgi:hypothetical protein